MTKLEIVEYCKSKKGAAEDFPFDDEVLTMRVIGKCFAFINIKTVDNKISLKCDPELAVLLREHYKGIVPGWHLNKKHWNTVDADLDVPDDKLKELIDHSYGLILKSLTRADREKVLGSMKV